VQDYLNQLVSRNQQSELLVQPRPLSRFETPQNSILASFDPSETSLDTLEPVTVEESGESEPPNHQSTALKVDERQSVQPIKSDNTDKEREVVAAMPGITVSMDGKAESHSSRRPVDSLDEHSTDLMRHSDKSDENQLLSTNNPSTEKQVLPYSIERTVQEKKIQMQPIASFVVSRNDGNSQEKESLPDLTQPTVSRERGQTSPENLDINPLFEWNPTESSKSNVPLESRREIIKPFIESAVSQNTANSVADTPAVPTIQITIGRIEVRASTATASAKKTPAKSSAMSLDDYLKQRQRGART